MQTTFVATMLQSHMRPDVGQFSVELAELQHIYVCSDKLQSLMRPDVGQLSVELAELRHIYDRSNVEMGQSGY